MSFGNARGGGTHSTPRDWRYLFSLSRKWRTHDWPLRENIPLSSMLFLSNRYWLLSQEDSNQSVQDITRPGHYSFPARSNKIDKLQPSPSNCMPQENCWFQWVETPCLYILLILGTISSTFNWQHVVGENIIPKLDGLWYNQFGESIQRFLVGSPGVFKAGAKTSSHKKARAGALSDTYRIECIHITSNIWILIRVMTFIAYIFSLINSIPIVS